jgi:hypothetical protein
LELSFEFINPIIDGSFYRRSLDQDVIEKDVCEDITEFRDIGGFWRCMLLHRTAET